MYKMEEEDYAQAYRDAKEGKLSLTGIGNAIEPNHYTLLNITKRVYDDKK